MFTVSTTELRNHLFDCLDRISEGETIFIQRHNREVTRLVPAQKKDWKPSMSVTPQFLVSLEEIIEPTQDDEWEEYL